MAEHAAMHPVTLLSDLATTPGNWPFVFCLENNRVYVLANGSGWAALPNAAEVTDEIADAIEGIEGGAWGGITGVLATQLDLQGVLDDKAESNHHHTGTYEPANANIQAHVIAPHAPLSAYSRVTGSNATTTGQALANIAGLTLPLLANSVYEFEAVLMVASSSTAGNGYGVNYSAAGAVVEAQVSGTLAAATAKAMRVSSLNTSAQPFVTVAGNGGILIKGIITTGANAGNLTISHLKVTSGTSTVFIGSYLKVIKI